MLTQLVVLQPRRETKTIMRQTSGQRSAERGLRVIAGSFRVTQDPEGWPIIPGASVRSNTTTGVFTDRRRMHAKILAIPAIQRHQTGDEELRAVFPPSALPAVASVI